MLSTLIRAHGTEEFWDLLSAWWVSEYVRPVELATEKRLEGVFGDATQPVTTFTGLVFSVEGVQIGTCSSFAGRWRYGHISIGVKDRPNALRRALVWTVTGAVWVDNEKG